MNKVEALTKNAKAGITIEPHISIKGIMVVSGSGAIQIGGHLEGRLDAADCSVIVQKGATVEGTIVGAHIAINGTVKSLSEDDYIEAKGNLALGETAKVELPSIRYGSISMECGASIRGDMAPLNTGEIASATTSDIELEDETDMDAEEAEDSSNQEHKVSQLQAHRHRRPASYYQPQEDPTVGIDEITIPHEDI